MKSNKFPLLIVTATLATSVFLSAAPAALPLRFSLNLSDFKGQPFLAAMQDKEKGIKTKLDADYKQEFTVADWPTIEKAFDNFDAKVQRKIIGTFTVPNPNRANPEADKAEAKAALQTFASKLVGKKFTPDNLFSLAAADFRAAGHKNPNPKFVDPFGVLQLVAFASGAGTLVTIDEANYYYNYGYKFGTGPKDVQSGRSFGAGPDHPANDASDLEYLSELESYLKSTRDPRDFYGALLSVITESDVAGFKAEGMTNAAQTVATDFVAIYTAETDRHIMTKLTQHAWENDLAEVTFIVGFGAVTGKIMLNGKFQDGKAEQYWAKSSFIDPATGKPSGRSGIGITREGRRALQKYLTDYERKNNPEVVTAIEAIVGNVPPPKNVARRGQPVKMNTPSIYETAMEFINSNDAAKQAKVHDQAPALKKALVDFILQTQKDSADITREILAKHALGT